MRPTRSLLVLVLLGGALSVAGCGQSTTTAPPILTAVPLTAGTRIVAQQRRCDRGASPYCAEQLVVVGAGYPSSAALRAGERRHLDQLGWTLGIGDTGEELSADSPGHKLRITFATANDDLKGVDLGWIERSPPITRALSTVLFDRAPAISVMLQTGSS